MDGAGGGTNEDRNRLAEVERQLAELRAEVQRLGRDVLRLSGGTGGLPDRGPQRGAAAQPEVVLTVFVSVGRQRPPRLRGVPGGPVTVAPLKSTVVVHAPAELRRGWETGMPVSVVTTTASTILANVVTFVSTVVAMVILSWQLTIVAVITVPVFFWLTKTVGERRRRVARSTQESLAAMSALSEETLSVSGVLLAKVFGSQARDTARYHQENQRLADLEVRQQMIGQDFYAIVQSFLSITPAAVYLIAGLLLAHGTAISAGTIVAFTTLQTRLYFPVGQLLQVSVELRSSLALFDRVFEYLDVVPDIVDAPDAVDLPAISSGGRVALREVYFRYPGTPVDALAGVSFDVGPGGGNVQWQCTGGDIMADGTIRHRQPQPA